MSDPESPPDIAQKIARLIAERGWNQEDFARISRLNRHTVRNILHGGGRRRLRNATISRCAEALGLSVSELRDLPLERLLARWRGRHAAAEENLQLLRNYATDPQLRQWLETHPKQAAELDRWQIEELLAAQGRDGRIASCGIENVIDCLQRRRRIAELLRSVQNPRLLELIEELLGMMLLSPASQMPPAAWPTHPSPEEKK